MAQDVRRTADELTKPQLNYYLAFKVDPAETDQSKIETVIKKAMSSTSGDVFGRRLLELKTDILETMVNDAVFDAASGSYRPGAGGRKKEAAAAKEFKLDEVVTMVEILCTTRKTLLKSELSELCTKANKPVEYFTEADFDARVNKYLSGIGVKIIDNTDAEILFGDYKKADDALKALSKESLYDFLGVPNNAPKAQIATAHADCAKSISKIADLKKKQSYNTLTPMADKLLVKSDKVRGYYDFYLATKDAVWTTFDTRKSYGIKDIPLEDYEKYVSETVSATKCSLAEAEKFIAAGCKFYQVTITGKADASNLEYCPYDDCKKLYVSGAKTCPHCGKPLEIMCWNCGGKMPFTNKSKTCSTCGCTFQSKDLFEKRVGEMAAVFRSLTATVNDMKSALSNLQNVVPNYQSHPNGYVAKKVKEYETQIQQRIKEEETVGANYRTAVDKIKSEMALKNFQQALGLAQNLRRTYPTYQSANTMGLINDINKVIAQAQTFINQAKTYMTQNNDAQVIACASKAMEICADHGEARQLLQKFPPKAPTNVKLSIVKEKVVRVEWTRNGSQDMTTYTVVKKAGARPASITDGTVLAKNLTISFYEDENVVSATPYYYAVYAERSEIFSAPAVSPSPIQLFLNVSNVRQEVVPDCISVKWDAPHNVKSIDVWRKDGPVPPANAGDGVKVATKGLEGFLDEKCARECSYLIVCNYEMNGAKHASSGIRSLFKQYVLLSPLTNVSIRPQAGGDFLLSCDEPSEGKVGVLYSKNRIACKYDTPIRRMEYNQVCKDCTAVALKFDSEGNTVFSLPQNQILWAYPMVSNDQLFVLSQPVLVNTLSGIQNVSYSESGGTVRIVGKVDPGIKNVIVKVSNKAFPLSLNDDGDKLVIPKDKFLTDGAAVIKLKADTMNYISVFTEVEQNGKQSYTRAVPIGDAPIGNLRQITVLYALEYKVSAMKEFPVTVKFECEEPVATPKSVLMKGSPRPLNKEAGELVEKIDSMELRKGFFGKTYTGKVTVKAKPDALNMKFILFGDDPARRHIKLKEVSKL